MKARVLVRDWQLEDVHPSAPVELKSCAYPFRTFAGKVDEIMPAAALDRPVGDPETPTQNGQPLSNYIAIVMRFPNPNGLLLEGRTGTAKILGHRRPIAWRSARGIWRWVRTYAW
jgi:hypothetical protein